MTRLLFLGDAGATGFGTVTWDLGTRLLEQGMDIRFLSQNVNSEPIAEPLGSRTWDVSHHTFDLLATLTRGFRDGWRADVMLLVGDFAAVNHFVRGLHPDITAAFTTTPTFHYIPVEGVGLPPAWKPLWEIVRPVAMSEFGADQIESVTGVRPPVVLHGVSGDHFYPISRIRPGIRQGQPIHTKAQAKRSFGFPEDRIMVLRTDRHMPRKQYNRLIRAMPEVFSAVPELDLVIHCRAIDQGGNLMNVISGLPPEFQTRVLLTRGLHNTFTGLPREDLNCLYNAADIYVSNSAEGFGLTIAEAIACGVPAVAMDYSAVPEVVGPAGITVPYDHLTDNEYDHFWAAVDVPKMQDALIRLATRPAQRRQLGGLGPIHVRRMFDWDEKARQFSELIESAVASEVAA